MYVVVVSEAYEVKARRRRKPERVKETRKGRKAREE